VRSLRPWAVLALLAAYALPAFFPPAATPLLPPAIDAGLGERVFPGVPGWWMWVRLAALAAGATLAVVGAPRGRGVRAGCVDASIAPPPRAMWLAACVALALCVWATRAAHMARPEQMAFIGALALPTLLALAIASTPDRWSRPGSLGAVVAVVALWAITWLPVAWRSPWIASLVDGSGVLGMLDRTRDPAYNLLVDTIRPGQNSLFLVFQGGGLLGWLDVVPTIPFVQGVHAAWLAVAAILVATAATRLVAPSTAPVAAATLLAAPLVMVETMFMGPQVIGHLLPCALVLGIVAIHRRRSPAAMVLVGLVTGIMATLASLMALACPGFAFALALALRKPCVPAAAIVAAVGTFAACVVPVLFALQERLPELYTFYNSGTAEWATMENTYFGQLDPDLVRFQLTGTTAAPFDALIGSLLAPFAAPRTGMRLWGDCLFDPLGAALAAVGIAYCLRERTVASWALLGMLVLATAPGGLSSYDRASLLRLPAAPVPVVLLAAVGIRVLVSRFLPGVAEPGVAQGVAIALLVSGWVVMVVVNPRILPRSATGIAIEAVRDEDVRDAVVLVAYGWDPQASPVFLESLPPAPLRWTAYDTAADLERAGGVGRSTLLFWSPGVEDRSGVAASVCARWPDARLYVLTDAARLSRAFAATTDGRAWTPALPAERWTAMTCPVTLPTEGRTAAAAVAAARELMVQGRTVEAVNGLRQAARGSIVAFALYEELARALLATATTPAELDEVAFWARRAATVSGYCAPGAVATLVEVYTRLGRDEEVRATRDAEKAAVEGTCPNLAADHPLRG
jgi:hypothetical protein